jgi:hypothetical protein
MVPGRIGETAVNGTRKIGLGLAIFLSLVDIVTAFLPVLFDAGSDETGGSPVFLSLLGLSMGVLTLVAVTVVWRNGHRAANWLVILTRVISALAGVPAFIFGAPVFILASVVVQLVLTVLCVVLLLRPLSVAGSVQGQLPQVHAS